MPPRQDNSVSHYPKFHCGNISVRVGQFVRNQRAQLCMRNSARMFENHAGQPLVPRVAWVAQRRVGLKMVLPRWASISKLSSNAADRRASATSR